MMENNEMPQDLIDCVMKFRHEVKETENEFIYKRISPYCEYIVEKKLSKAELKSILHNGMQAEQKANKIIAEVENQAKWLLSAGYNAYNVDIAFDSILSRIRKELLGK